MPDMAPLIVGVSTKRAFQHTSDVCPLILEFTASRRSEPIHSIDPIDTVFPTLFRSSIGLPAFPCRQMPPPPQPSVASSLTRCLARKPHIISEAGTEENLSHLSWRFVFVPAH